MTVPRGPKKVVSYLLYICAFIVAVYFIWSEQQYIKLGVITSDENPREAVHEKRTTIFTANSTSSNGLFPENKFTSSNETLPWKHTDMFKLTGVVSKSRSSKATSGNIREELAQGTSKNETLSIVYNEHNLLARIKAIHDSRYKPPTKELCARRMPQCVILGMRKCGTQELIDFLSMHPNVMRRGKPVYEINCFLSDRKLKDCKGEPNLMPCSYSDQITLSKSSIYFTTPGVAERLYNYNHTLRMILLVREPVERLIADYSFEFFQRHGKNQTRHSEGSSSVYRKMEPLDRRLVSKLTGRINPRVPEVVRSTYDRPMHEYLKYFKPEQILVIESKELKDNPINVLRKVEVFLGLERAIQDSDFVFNKEKGFYCVRNGDSMNCYGDNRGRAKSPTKISRNTRRRLGLFFRKHNEEFFRLIGKRYDW